MPDPDGGPALFNAKSVDIRLKLSKQYNDTLARLQAELKRRDADQAADSRMVVEAVNDAVNRLTGMRRTAAIQGAEEDPLSSMYNVGGM